MNYNFITFVLTLLYIELLVDIIERKKGGVVMKKAVKIISIVIAVLIMAPIVIFNIQSIIISAMFNMPSEMKEETVCFLAPGLTWDSTRSDVEECFGLQVKDSHYIEETGKVIETYNASYENRLMTVETTRCAFVITDVFHKCRIHHQYKGKN